jgi:hypothetical protein
MGRPSKSFNDFLSRLGQSFVTGHLKTVERHFNVLSMHIKGF